MPRARPFSSPASSAGVQRHAGSAAVGPASAATKASSRRAARSRAGGGPSSPSRRTRGENGSPPASFAGRLAAPEHHAVGRHAEGLVGVGREPAQPPGHLRPDRALGGGAQGLVLQRARAARRLEAQPRQPADVVALDGHRPVGGDAGQQRVARRSSPRIRALVRRSMNRCISRSCRVSESRSSSARVRPCQWAGVAQPVGAVGDVGQGAHAGEARPTGRRCRRRAGRAA